MYKFFCNFYSNLITFYENKFLKIKYTKSNLEKNGYSFYTKENEQVEKIIGNYYEIIEKKYQSLYLYNKKELEKIIKIVFSESFRKYITDQTGFNYSIDFFTAYKNMNISGNDIELGWYGNNYHFDKPYSKNMLKVMVPTENLGNAEGPLELLDKRNSNLLVNKKKYVNKKIRLTGKIGDKCLFLPNVCLHKALIPEEKKSANLLMFQLNPSKNWTYNSKIFDKQVYREPKFPFVSYFFDKRLSII